MAISVSAVIALIGYLFSPSVAVGLLVVGVVFAIVLFFRDRSETSPVDTIPGLTHLAAAGDDARSCRLVPGPKNWKPRLLQIFSNTVTIHGDLKYEEPLIDVGDDFKLTSGQERKAAIFSQNLAIEHKADHTQLVLSSQCQDWKPHPRCMEDKADWESDPIVLRTNPIKYSSVMSFRKDKFCVPTLSANAILVCPDRRCVVLQQRSKTMDTYGEGESYWIHTVGGGYQHDWPESDGDLISTMVREVQEELKVHVICSRNTPRVVLGELTTGFIQVNYLGIQMSTTQIDHIAPKTEEGFNFIVSFDELYDKLLKPNWVPSGKCAVLIWLAFGAPKAALDGEKPVFGGKTPHQLFEALVPELKAEAFVGSQ